VAGLSKYYLSIKTEHNTEHNTSCSIVFLGKCMPNYTLTINRQNRTVTASEDTPLLWILRDELGLTGTKYGCGIAQCGACTVHLDGSPVRSCSVPVSAVQKAAITTIEGLAEKGLAEGNTAGAMTNLHPVQKAWIEEDVPQCGYCQSGQIMSAAALLANNPKPSDAEIDAALAGHICRCGTYPRIRKAVRRAALVMQKR
jgi:isoquinoline 1-oxidoreductase subunit alpha